MINEKEMACAMNVGETKIGAQLLQRSDNNTLSTPARDKVKDEKSIEVYQKIKENVDEQPSRDQTKQLAEQLNDLLEHKFTDVKFEFHEKLEKYYVTVVDSKSKEVIKEIPPRKMLDVYASIAESMGLIVDEKV